jgi:hypothetical protein
MSISVRTCKKFGKLLTRLVYEANTVQCSVRVYDFSFSTFSCEGNDMLDLEQILP